MEMNGNRGRGGRKERGGGRQGKGEQTNRSQTHSKRQGPSSSSTPGSWSRGGRVHINRRILGHNQPIQQYVDRVISSSDDEEDIVNPIEPRHVDLEGKMKNLNMRDAQSNQQSTFSTYLHGISSKARPHQTHTKTFPANRHSPVSSSQPGPSSARADSYSNTKRLRPFPPVVPIPDGILSLTDDEEVAQERPFRESSLTRTEEEIKELDEKARHLYTTRLEDLRLHHRQARYYPSWDVETFKEPIFHGNEGLLNGYTHEQACRFLAMMSVWEAKEPEEMEGVERFEDGLIRGDLVAVKELYRTPDGKWAARKIKVLQREIERNQKFMELPNGRAVAIYRGQQLVLQREAAGNDVFIGDIFTPTQYSRQPCRGATTFFESLTPPLLPVVFNIRPCPEAEKYIKEFLDESRQTPPTDAFIEFCGGMGSAAYRATRNARSDDGIYEMKNVVRYKTCIQFEGNWDPKLWVEPKLRLGRGIQVMRAKNYGKNGEIVEVEIPEDIEIDPMLVCQSNMKIVGSLHPGFFTKLPNDSNGKAVIKALFGGPKIPRLADWYSNLNPPRRYYASFMACMPLTIGDFVLGKSRILVKAAWALSERSPLTQNLLIVQKHSDALSLIRHFRKIQGVQRVVRYVSEQRWQAMKEDERTEFDFPFLLRKLLREIVDGKREVKDLKIEGVPHYKNKIIYDSATFLIEHDGFQKEDLSKKVKSLVKEHWGEVPDLSEYLKIFNVFEKPRIIISTTDSVWRCLKVFKSIRSVQFDEAQRIPISCLIETCSLLTHASFGWMRSPRALENQVDISPMGPLLSTLSFGHETVFNEFERIESKEIYDQDTPIF
uniref:DNA (cytosine-5-)-methyltransferase n=2 Tax=Caenorhabditis tropicalis TaxID=1561998 RepID=A0A1I7UTU0_9PELO